MPYVLFHAGGGGKPRKWVNRLRKMLPEDDEGMKALIKRHNGEIERQVGKTPQRWHFSGNLGNGRGQRDQAEGDWRRDGGHPQSCNAVGDGIVKTQQGTCL